MKLKIKDCRVKSVTGYPKGDDQFSQVLVVAGLLTPAVATRLKVRDGCFRNSAEEGKREEWVPHVYDAYPSPSFRVDGADVTLGEKQFRATMLHKFKIAQPKAGGDNDVSLEVQFRLHFSEDVPVYAWVLRQKKKAFDFLMSARQEDLKFSDDEPDEEEEGPEEGVDAGCVSCNNEVAMGLGGYHQNGQRCTAKDKEPALASAREAAGGTHQKRNRGKVQQIPDPAVQ